MPFPTGAIITTDLDSDADSPLNARGDIKQTADFVNDIIGSRGAPNGIAPLGADNKVPATHLPADLAKLNVAQAWTGNQAFQTITLAVTNLLSSNPITYGSINAVPAIPGRFLIPITGQSGGILVQWTTTQFNIAANGTQTFTWPTPFSTGYVIFVQPWVSSLVKYSASISSTTYQIVCDATPVNFYVLGIGRS